MTPTNIDDFIRMNMEAVYQSMYDNYTATQTAAAMAHQNAYGSAHSAMAASVARAQYNAFAQQAATVARSVTETTVDALSPDMLDAITGAS